MKVDINLDGEGKQILLGSLLGDGCITRSKIVKTYSYHYQESHSMKQEGYGLWKSKKLNLNYGYYTHKGRTKSFNDGLQIHISKKSKRLQPYWYIFYKNGRKEVSLEILNQLNEIGLMVWYLDDGCLDTRGHIHLATLGFSLSENMIMIEWFKLSLGMNPILVKCRSKHNGNRQYSIMLGKYKDVQHFLNLFRAYVEENIPDMKYKVNFNESLIIHSRNLLYDWRRNNKQKVIELDRKYYYQNRKKRIKSTMDCYKRHREEYNKRQMRWYYKNRERINKRRRELRLIKKQQENKLTKNQPPTAKAVGMERLVHKLNNKIGGLESVG